MRKKKRKKKEKKLNGEKRKINKTGRKAIKLK